MPKVLYRCRCEMGIYAFYRSIHISHPSKQDAASAKARGLEPGEQIMIHGQRNGFGWLGAVIQWFN